MARRFQFRLETVREIRRRERDDRRRAVAEAIRAAAADERRIEQLTELLRDGVEQARDERRSGRLDPATLRGRQFHQTWMHGRLLDLQTSLSERKAALEAERSKLAWATARLKAIEKLREKRRRRYATAVTKEEQAINDEVASRIAAPAQTVEIGEGWT